MSAPETPTLIAAVRRVSLAYNALAESQRPDILDEAWNEREAAIDATYVARDIDGFRQAVVEWERFALATFEAAR
jgi:hypothetical protein